MITHAPEERKLNFAMYKYNLLLNHIVSFIDLNDHDQFTQREHKIIMLIEADSNLKENTSPTAY